MFTQLMLFFRFKKVAVCESYVSCFVIMELQISATAFFFRRGEIFRNRSLTLSHFPRFQQKKKKLSLLLNIVGSVHIPRINNRLDGGGA